MIKFACAGWGFRALDAPDYFRLAHRIGFNAVEINLGDDANAHLPCDAGKQQLARITRWAEETGVRIVAAAMGNDFTIADAAKRLEQVACVKRQVDLCAAIDIEVLRIFAGFAPQDQLTDTMVTDVRNCLQACAEHAEKFGVTLAVENHGGITRTGRDCQRLLQGLTTTPAPPSVRSVLGLNYDPGNFRFGDEDPLAALKLIRDRIVYSHWKDVSFNGNQRSHCAVGEGVIDWKPIVQTLIDTGYDGYWAIEYEAIEDVERGTRQSLNHLKSLLAS